MNMNTIFTDTTIANNAVPDGQATQLVIETILKAFFAEPVEIISESKLLHFIKDSDLEAICSN